MRRSARFELLESDQNDLEKLALRSDLIKIHPKGATPGLPPDRYLVTYACNGVAGLQPDGRTPLISTEHQVEIHLSANYPNREPSLLWLTKVWHPNIDNDGHVCTNNIDYWWANRTVADLIVDLGRMAKYEWYFAEDRPPFPYNKVAAAWVRDVAEPEGWVGPDKPNGFDERPLLKPLQIMRVDPATIEKRRRIVLGEAASRPKAARIVLGDKEPV